MHEETQTRAEKGAAPGPDGSPGPELAETLALLDEAQGFIRTIFLGLALQYKSFDIRRCQLLFPEEENLWNGMEPSAVQTAASLITLCALFGFQRQTEQLACQEAQAGGNPDLTDVKLGAAVILIALIRLVRLQSPARGGSRRAAYSPSEQESALEETLSEADE